MNNSQSVTTMVDELISESNWAAEPIWTVLDMVAYVIVLFTMLLRGSSTRGSVYFDVMAVQNPEAAAFTMTICDPARHS